MRIENKTIINSDKLEAKLLDKNNNEIATFKVNTDKTRVINITQRGKEITILAKK